jgi:hypothetical protein
MATKVIRLKDLKKDPETLLRKCCDSGQQFVVELPDRRKVTIKAFEEDDLINDLIENNSAFQAKLTKSASSKRKPFQASHS